MRTCTLSSGCLVSPSGVLLDGIYTGNKVEQTYKQHKTHILPVLFVFVFPVICFFLWIKEFSTYENILFNSKGCFCRWKTLFEKEIIFM